MNEEKVRELFDALIEQWEDISFGFIAEDISITEYHDASFMIQEAVRAFLHQEVVDLYDVDKGEDLLFTDIDKKVAMSLFLKQTAEEVMSGKFDQWD